MTATLVESLRNLLKQLSSVIQIIVLKSTPSSDEPAVHDPTRRETMTEVSNEEDEPMDTSDHLHDTTY
jgi:hypothetical protein